MRAELEEDRMALPYQVSGRGFELHRLANVTTPVLRAVIHGCGRAAGDGRDQGQGRRVDADALEGLVQLVAIALHLRRVEGIIHVEPAREDVVFRQHIEECRERDLVARHHGGGRAVHRRDGQAIVPALQPGLDLLARQADGRHPAAARGKALHQPTPVDMPRIRRPRAPARRPPRAAATSPTLWPTTASGVTPHDRHSSVNPTWKPRRGPAARASVMGHPRSIGVRRQLIDQRPRDMAAREVRRIARWRRGRSALAPAGRGPWRAIATPCPQ